MNPMDYTFKVIAALESFGLVHCEQVECSAKTIVLTDKSPSPLSFDIPPECMFFCVHTFRGGVEIHLSPYCDVAFSDE